MKILYKRRYQGMIVKLYTILQTSFPGCPHRQETLGTRFHSSRCGRLCADLFILARHAIVNKERLCDVAKECLRSYYKILEALGILKKSAFGVSTNLTLSKSREFQLSTSHRNKPKVHLPWLSKKKTITIKIWLS